MNSLNHSNTDKISVCLRQLRVMPNMLTWRTLMHIYVSGRLVTDKNNWFVNKRLLDLCNAAQRQLSLARKAPSLDTRTGSALTSQQPSLVQKISYKTLNLSWIIWDFWLSRYEFWRPLHAFGILKFRLSHSESMILQIGLWIVNFASRIQKIRNLT